MDPFETLNDDHRLIERMLTALLTYSNRIDEADPADLASFVVFFTEIGERHHTKEEGILFEAMFEVGFPRRTGPLATMRREHDEARTLVGLLGEASARAAAWTDGDRAHVQNTSRALVHLLRAHLLKEDTIIHPMARHNLPAECVASIAARFEELDSSPEARAERIALQVMAEILTARYGEAPVRRPRYAVAVMN